ncbi:YgfZ/GcvT domain-containing protein [Neisseriaceae bacterium B1]
MHTQLPFFGVIRATGDERHDFLHNQLSNDIIHLAANQACYATYNTPKGRVIANMIVLNTGTELLLILAADLAETVCKRLKMFVLRAKVQLEVLPDWGVSGSLKDDAEPILPSEPQLVLTVNGQGEIQLPHSGSLKVAPKAKFPDIDEKAVQIFNRHEIESGYPWISAATTETCVAQMLNQHIIGGVHFRKGCYPGQEIIARAQYRGQVKRGLALASNEKPQNAGAEVLDEKQAEAGLVLNVAGEKCLLVLKFGMAQSELKDVSGSLFQLEHTFFDVSDDVASE